MYGGHVFGSWIGGYDPRSMELMKDTRAKTMSIRRRLWDAWVDSFPLDLDLQQSTSVLGFIARSSNQTRLWYCQPASSTPTRSTLRAKPHLRHKSQLLCFIPTLSVARNVAGRNPWQFSDTTVAFLEATIIHIIDPGRSEVILVDNVGKSMKPRRDMICWSSCNPCCIVRGWAAGSNGRSPTYGYGASWPAMTKHGHVKGLSLLYPWFGHALLLSPSS